MGGQPHRCPGDCRARRGRAVGCRSPGVCFISFAAKKVGQNGLAKNNIYVNNVFLFNVSVIPLSSFLNLPSRWKAISEPFD